MLSARGTAVLISITISVAVSQSFGRFTYSVLLTDIRADLEISNTIAGSLGSANLAGYLAGSLAVSLVVGRLGLRNVAAIGIVFVTAGLALLSWSPNVGVVALGLVLTGFMAAGVWVTAPALAAEEMGSDQRASGIGIIFAGVGSGMVLSSWLDTMYEWRVVYRIETALAVVAVVMSFSLSRRTPHRVVGRLGVSAIRAVPGWRPLLAAYGLYGAGMAMVITFLVALLEDDAGYSSARATAAFIAMAVGSIIGGPLYGSLLDRAGRQVGLLTAFTTMAMSSAAIATGHRPGATLAAFIFGTAFVGVPIAVAARIGDHVSGQVFSAAFGVATLVFGAGMTVGPQLGGALADAAGSFRPAYAIAATAAVAGAFLSAAASRDPKEPLPDGAPKRSTPTGA